MPIHAGVHQPWDTFHETLGSCTPSPRLPQSQTSRSTSTTPQGVALRHPHQSLEHTPATFAHLALVLHHPVDL
jgi:hypothetical protein